MEQAVIVGLLSEPAAILDIAGRLRAEMFGDADLRLVYTAILSLNEKGIAVDMLTVEDEMLRLDAAAFDRLNGLSFLATMLVAVRNNSHIRTHADEVVRRYVLRRLLAGMQELQIATAAPDADVLADSYDEQADRQQLQRALAELQRLPIIVEYCGSDTVDDIRAKALMLHKQGKLDVCFIDYLNLINLVVPKGSLQETTDLAMGSVARRIKLMAEEMQVPVVLLAQMNRESEKRPAPHFPVLSDLRNSGAIEQIADVVIFVYRAEKYNIFYDKNTKEDLRGVGMLLIAKNRNGATGMSRFRYNPSMTCLTDYDLKLFGM